MAEMAEAAGLQGAVIVNTCAVTAEAVRKARQEIRRLARENPGAPIIVTGCAAQTEPETFAAMPEVARVIGNHEKMQPATWSDLMAEMAEAAGLQGAVIVNTCAVTAEAVRKARQEIRRLARENPGAPIIVTGCAAQTEPETFAAMPEVARVIGNHEKMQPATW